MLMSGEFYLKIPYHGNTGYANKTILKIGTFQFPYSDWLICGNEFAVSDKLYLRIPSGYIDGIIRYIDSNNDYIYIDFDGVWRGKYNGLLFGKCAYGEFYVYPTTGIVYESRFFPMGYDWAIALELYHVISVAARYQGLRPEQHLSMSEFIELCFTAGVHYATQNLQHTVTTLENHIDILIPHYSLKMREGRS